MPKPDYMKYIENEELLAQEAKKIYKIIKDANPDNFNFTEEDFINAAKDKKRQELFVKAHEYIDLTEERRALMNKYEKSGLFNSDFHRSMSRHAFTLLDTEDTLETDIKNIKMLNSFTTKTGATEEIYDEIDELIHFDLTKIDFKSDDELIDFYKNNYKLAQKAFVWDSAIANSGFYMDEEVAAFLKRNDGLIQTIKQKSEDLNAYASIVNLVLPEGVKLEHLVFAAKGLTEYNKFEYDSTLSFVDRKENHHFDNDNIGFSKLVEDGIITKDFVFEYNTYDAYDKEKINDKDYKLPSTKSNRAIKAYGEAYSDYQKLDKKENDITFEEYLKSRSMDKMFVKRSPEEVQNDRVKKLLESKKFILSDKEVKTYIDNKVDELRNLGGAYGRSTRRIDAAKEYIDDLLKPDSTITINGLQVGEGLKKMFALRAGNLIEDIHKNRGFIWKVFHPRQNAREKSFVNGLNDYLKGKGLPQKHIDNARKAYGDLCERMDNDKLKLETPLVLPTSKDEKNIDKTVKLEVSPQLTKAEQFKNLANDTAEKSTTEVSKKPLETTAKQVELDMDK